MTRRSEALDMIEPEPEVHINPDDLKGLQASQGKL